MGCETMLELIALAMLAAVSYGLYEANRRLAGLEERMRSAEMLAHGLQDDMVRLKTGFRRGGAPEANGPEASSAPGSVPPAVVNPKTEGPGDRAVRTAVPAIPAPLGTPAAAGLSSGAAPVPPVAPGGRSGPGAPPPSQPSLPPQSLEEQLGTRWAVWVGGIALALGGLLLVRYTIEQGYFGPGMRIVLGLILAAALVTAGELFRRDDVHNPGAADPSAHIPGVLTAAGTAIAFGTIYAAHGVYGFIGPSLAFILLGAVGIATMLASALHGPWLAGLGVAGSYLAPLLVSSSRPSPWPLLIYLAVVTATAMGLSRIRGWLWLALVAVAGGFVWGLPFAGRMATLGVEWQLVGELHILIQLALAAAFIAILPHPARPDREAAIDLPATGALGAFTVLTVLFLLLDRASFTAMVPFALAVPALLMATAWVSAPAAGGALFAGVVVLAGILSWPGLSLPPDRTLLAPAMSMLIRLPDNVLTFLLFAALTSGAVSLAAGWRLSRGRTLPLETAALYALAATLTPLLALLLAYLRVTQFDSSILFAAGAFGLAALSTMATEHFQVAESQDDPGSRLATGAFAAGAIAAVSLGLMMCLERGYLTVALALTAAGTASIAQRRDIPALRYVVSVLAAVVLARIAWDPLIMGAEVGRWPLFNWLLIGYGLPAAAFWIAARLMEGDAPAGLESQDTGTARRGRVPTDIHVGLADATAILLTALLCFFQIRHLLNQGRPLVPSSGHVEQGLFAIVSLGLSYALMRLELRRANEVFHWASLGFGVLSGVFIVWGLGFAHNPFLTYEPVTGFAVFSSLVLAYLLPGVAAARVSLMARPHRPDWYVTGLAVLGLMLVFGYVTLEVRHLFQGPDISSYRRTSGAEQWAYSVAWLALGVAFLAYGVWRGSLEARFASAGLVVLSVAKVFLIDLNGLTGLWRALSFIVLGFVLIGIGLVYQKIIFAKPSGGGDSDAPANQPV
jgi:uncharacterized membrane protein